MHLRECGEKMPPQIAWSYWREEAALIIELVIYCPGSPGCSGSPFAARFPVLPLQRHTRKTRRLSWIKNRGRKTSLPSVPVRLSLPTARHRGAGAAPARDRAREGPARVCPRGCPARPLPKAAATGGDGRGGQPHRRDHPELGQACPGCRGLGITEAWESTAAPVPVRCHRAETARHFAASL